jgi:hypothetical protein
MICANCETTLPDEAIACWKCGTQISALTSGTPPPRNEPDILLVLLTFVAAVAFFACAGWAVPFTVWGTITTAAKDSPEWSAVLGILGGLAFVVSTIVCFGGFWYGAYWLTKRIIASPKEA